MKTYNAFLILTLLMWSSFASAFNYHCVGKEKTVAPSPKTYQDSDGNTQYTDEFKAWKDAHGDWSARQDWGCCDKLVKNATTRVCEDPSMVDDSLIKCTGHGQCNGGLGCYSLRDDDMFTYQGDDDAAEAAMQEKEAKFEEQQNSLGDVEPKELGQACYRDMECESYKCNNFKCESPITICRLADEGESAPGAIKCEEPYVKENINSVCTNNGVEYFNGLLGKILVSQKQSKPGDPAATRCEFQLNPTEKDSNGNPLTTNHIEGAINLGIKTIRSMEWLYSTVSKPDDCLFSREYMKGKMLPLIERRKAILSAYNTDMLEIEANFKEINAAQLEDQTSIDTLCADAAGGYEITTKHDIASRKSTGLDFLCYMKERNSLYKEYESAMLQWAADLQSYTTSYRDTVFRWGDKDKNWTTGDKSYGWRDRGCRDWTDWHKKVKRRWTDRYKVKGRDDENEQAVDKPGVTEYLKFIGDSNAPTSFKSKTYYLIDPLMPGNIGFMNYGDKRFLRSRFHRKLRGGDGLIDIYDAFDAKLLEYLKTLRTGQSPETFIHEPEIRGSYEMRGCVDNPNAPACKQFRKYVDDLKDYAFAQMLAYSRHSRKKYKKYFSDEGGWRRKLYARYDVDLTNLREYYTALSGDDGLRSKQNKCLDDLIAQLNRDFSTPEGTGVSTGASNYYNQTASDYMGGGGRGKDYNKAKIKNNKGKPRGFKLSALNHSMKTNSGFKDGMSGKTGAGSGSVGSAIGSGSLAARMKTMQDANAKAAAKGVNLGAKADELRDNMARAGLITSSGTGANAGRGGSSAGANAGFGSGSAGKKATLDDDEASDADKNASLGKGIAAGAAAGSAAGAAAGANAGSLSGIAAGSGSGYDSGSGSGANSGSGSGDPTGMSDEEKDRMAANYDRTKGQYKTNEDDSLFQVLSKTYVRNLDKILIRKKKLDEDAASFPSDPAKP